MTEFSIYYSYITETAYYSYITEKDIFSLYGEIKHIGTQQLDLSRNSSCINSEDGAVVCL